MPERNVLRYSQRNAECLNGKCGAIDIAKVVFAVYGQE